MASAGTRAATAVLLFSFSAVVFIFLLLQAPPPGLMAELLVSALDRFLDGRGLLELATRRNMILLCHAILLVILRDAGVLRTPAGRRHSRSPPGEATAAPARPDATRTAVVALTACSVAPVPARHHATRSTVVWRRRPQNRAVVAPMPEHDAAGSVVVDCRPAVEAAATTWAAPVLTTGPSAQAAEETAAVATKQIVVVESPKNDHDRAAVVEPLEHPTGIAADGEMEDCDDRRITTTVAAAEDTAPEQETARMEIMEMEMELADDKTFEDFIKSQRRQMRQESLQLLSSVYPYQYQAIATCY